MKIFCTRCGEQKEDKRYFCTRCGYRDPRINFESANKQEPPKMVQDNKAFLNVLKKTLE